MKKKTVRIRTHHAPHFYIFFAAIMIVVGAFATIVVTKVVGQGSDQLIYACVQKQSGALRMVTPGNSCRGDENALTWPATSTGLPFMCSNCQLFPYGDKFRGKDFSNAQLISDEFIGADLSGVIFKGAFLQNDDFSSTNLANADFSNLAYDLIHSAPSGWNFNSSNVQFTDANLTNANFSNSTLDSFSFKNANVQGVNFSNATISNSNFTKAQNMSSANVTGVTWSNTKCPDGTNSNNDGNTCVGHF